MEEAVAELDSLAPLFDSGCSDELQAFMCSAFFLDEGIRPHQLPPCQEVCQRVWRNCRNTLGSLLEKRPRVMTCRIYPIDKDCHSGMFGPPFIWGGVVFVLFAFLQNKKER